MPQATIPFKDGLGDQRDLVHFRLGTASAFVQVFHPYTFPSGAISMGGATSASTPVQLVGANASRSQVDVSNSSPTSGVWVACGATAVAGQGNYLPPQGRDTYFTQSYVSFIQETGGVTVRLGYQEF